MTGPGLSCRTLGAAAAGALVALGCATGGGSTRAGDADAIAAALERSTAPAPGPANGTGKPMAFVATSSPGGSQLVAVDLTSGKVAWKQAAEITARVVVGRGVVLATEKGGDLVAREVATGAPRWRDAAAPGARRMGYAIDGDTVCYVATAAQRGKGREAEVVALDAATGQPRWRSPLPSATVGGPAMRGGLVAVPVKSQYVHLLDARTGEELAQILSREEAATFVRALPEGLFFGSKGAFLAGRDTASGSRKAPGYLQPNLPKFVRPVLYWDMYTADQGNYSATDRNRVLWRVEADGGRARFGGGLTQVHSFRYFFAFDAATGALRWAYNNPRVEAVSSEHTGKAIVFITSDGELGALEAATGQRAWTARLSGVSVRGATFDADGFAPAAAADEPPPSLPQVLSSIIWDPDRRFSDVKIFAVDELARLPGREVTAELLKILEREGMPPAVYQKTSDALVSRKDASAIDLFVKALEVRSDYATERKTHGLDVLARAVAALKAKQAMPALLAHLRQPDTSPLVVVEIAEAAVAMEAREAIPALRDFLLQYRADPAFAGDPAPLVSVAEAVLKLGGAAERETLLFVAEDPKSLEALRAHCRRALAQTARAGHPAAAGQPAGKRASEGGTE